MSDQPTTPSHLVHSHGYTREYANGLGPEEREAEHLRLHQDATAKHLDHTFTYEVRVIPRDLEPGDKVERVNSEMDTVWATIASVEKVRRGGHTAYKVYLAEREDLPAHRRAWAEYRHLLPFTLQPTQKVKVERVADAKGLI